MSIVVDIQSRCYTSEYDVLQATNGAASEIKAIMESHMNVADDSRDQVIATPGFTTRSTIEEYDVESHRSVVVCAKGWHASNTVQLKIADITMWPKLQREILGVVDQYTSAESGAARTSLYLRQPNPQLYEETSEQLLNQADAMALAQATAKFKRIAKQCELFGNHIVSMQPERAAIAMPHAFLAAGSAPNQPAEFQAEYDDIYVRSSWNITWDFVDSGAGCRAEELGSLL